MLDIIIAVLLGLLMLLTAYLGVHVTLHPPETRRARWAYKLGFIACGLVALALVGMQTYRTNKAQEAIRQNITAISKAVDSLGNKASSPGLFISERHASAIVELLWKSTPHKICIAHGGAFETTSFYNQFKTLLTISGWNIVAEISIYPPDPRASMTVDGPSADDSTVLLLQRMFNILGSDLRYAGSSGMIAGEVTLHLP